MLEPARSAHLLHSASHSAARQFGVRASWIASGEVRGDVLD